MLYRWYNRYSSKSLTPQDAVKLQTLTTTRFSVSQNKYIKKLHRRSRNQPSCLEGSHFKPFVKCVRLLPGASRTKKIILTSNHKELLYILAVESVFHRLLRSCRKKYASLCVQWVEGMKSVSCSLWCTSRSTEEPHTNYLLFPFWKCTSQWLWGRSFIFCAVYSSECRGCSTAASRDLGAPTTEVQH